MTTAFRMRTHMQENGLTKIYSELLKIMSDFLHPRRGIAIAELRHDHEGTFELQSERYDKKNGLKRVRRMGILTRSSLSSMLSV